MIKNKRLQWKVQSAYKTLQQYRDKMNLMALTLAEAAHQPFCDDPAENLMAVEEDLNSMRQDLSHLQDTINALRNALEEEGSNEEK